jgi:hypothetical protein
MVKEGRAIYSCAFFMLSFVLIVVAKPPAVFDSSGRLRPFGIGADSATGIEKTLTSLGVVTAVLAIACFYLWTMMDMLLVE